jgi:hypothetical protein
LSPLFIIPSLVLIVVSYGVKSGTVSLYLRSQDVNKKRHLQGRVWVNSISGELVWVTVNGSVDLPSASADMLSIEGAQIL